MKTLALASILVLLACGSSFAQALRIVTSELPAAIKNVPYEVPIETASNGKCPEGNVGILVLSGTLPKGLDLVGGSLRGTPQEMGVFRFNVLATTQCAETVKTLQLVVTGKPVLFVDEREVVFERKVGSTAPVSTTLLISSTWPDLPYSVLVHPAEWLRANPAAGVTPGRGDALTGDAVSLEIDSAKLAPGVYHAAVTFYARDGANAPTVPVTLKVRE